MHEVHRPDVELRYEPGAHKQRSEVLSNVSNAAQGAIVTAKFTLIAGEMSDRVREARVSTSGKDWPIAPETARVLNEALPNAYAVCVLPLNAAGYDGQEATTVMSCQNVTVWL